MSGETSILVQNADYHRRERTNDREDDNVRVSHMHSHMILEVRNDLHTMTAWLDTAQTIRLINALLGNLKSSLRVQEEECEEQYERAAEYQQRVRDAREGFDEEGCNE